MKLAVHKIIYWVKISTEVWRVLKNGVIDIDQSLKSTIQATNQKPAPKIKSVPDICFFSPNRMIKNSKNIQEKLQHVMEKQSASARKKLFR